MCCSWQWSSGVEESSRNREGRYSNFERQRTRCNSWKVGQENGVGGGVDPDHHDVGVFLQSGVAFVYYQYTVVTVHLQSWQVGMLYKQSSLVDPSMILVEQVLYSNLLPTCISYYLSIYISTHLSIYLSIYIHVDLNIMCTYLLFIYAYVCVYNTLFIRGIQYSTISYSVGQVSQAVRQSVSQIQKPHDSCNEPMGHDRLTLTE